MSSGLIKVSVHPLECLCRGLCSPSQHRVTSLTWNPKRKERNKKPTNRWSHEAPISVSPEGVLFSLCAAVPDPFPQCHTFSLCPSWSLGFQHTNVCSCMAPSFQTARHGGATSWHSTSLAKAFVPPTECAAVHRNGAGDGFRILRGAVGGFE